MTPDLQQEFQLLRERAMQHLKEVAVSGSYRQVFSFWELPSFTPACRYTLYTPWPVAKNNKPFVSFTIWRSDLDVEKFRSPVERLKYPKDIAPTIEDDVLWLTAGEAESIENRIRGISIPLYVGPDTVVGCDGTSFEFRCYDRLFRGAALQWWEEYPVEWRPLTRAVVAIARELDERRKGRVQ